MFDGVVSPLANISTAVTDLGIGIEALIFWVLLKQRPYRSVQWWAIAFLCVAIAAFSGAIYHGFYQQLPPILITLFQQVTHVAISGSSAAMVIGSITSLFVAPLLTGMVGAIGLKFALFCHLGLTRENAFIYPVVDYLSAMIVVGLLCGWPSRSSSGTYRKWMLSGIGVSAIAAVILAIKWTVHPLLSPDAIYHLVQMLALYCFFQGSQLLRDRRLTNG